MSPVPEHVTFGVIVGLKTPYTSQYTCPIALPVRRNPKHWRLLIVSATSAPPFQPLRHQRKVCHPVLNRFTRHTLPTVNRKYFFMNILCIEFFCSQRTIERCSSAVHSSSTVAFLATETSLWRCACASATWTVLLPSDTHRNPITSITAVLLPIVACLLTLPRILLWPANFKGCLNRPLY
jgi:hypothetical protein